MAFVPREGGVPARVIAHLQRPGAPAQMTVAEVAKLVGKPAKQVPALLFAAIKGGALVKAPGADGLVAISLPAAEAAEQNEAEPAAEGGGVAAEFECCLWDTGELDLFGLEPIEVNGVAGHRVSAEQVARLAVLLLPLGR